jgi:surface polysaccharide O-acyltransferase-like enzyme
MLTGALLLTKKNEIGDFLKRKLFRIIFPLVFWSIIYILYSMIEKFLHGDKIDYYQTIQYIYLSFKNGSSFHLWYIYMIIGIYLFIPIIGKWVRNSNEKEILYFLLIWCGTNFLNHSAIKKFIPNIDLTYFSGYIGYIIIGYYLSTKSFKNQAKTKIISITLIVSGTIITAMGTYLVSLYKSVFDGVFYDYLTPNVLMISVGLFIFIKNYNFTKNKINSIFNIVGKYCYGIYLVHVLVLNILYQFGITWNFTNPIIAIPIITFICFFISGIIIFLVNKLPYGNYISG